MSEVYDEQISAGADDGTWSESGSHWWNVTSAYLWVGSGSVGFFRFLNLPMSQGATIDSAYLTVWTHDFSSSNSVNIRVRATAEDNAAAFPSTSQYSNDPGTRTTAYTDGWTIPGTRTVETTSPDIKNVIQEIVDRAGWSGGNAIAIALENNGSSFTNDLGG